MNLTIACPIFEREWIFDRWADSVESQVWPEGTEVRMHFVFSPGEDDTLGAIRRRFPDAWVTIAEGPTFRNEDRSNKERYKVLTEHRNWILRSAREWSKADYLLSWDSDLIFPPDTLGRLFIDEPVVGALVDMTGEDWLMDQGHGFPSFMFLDGEKAWRQEGWSSQKVTDPFQAGVVMGCVLIRRDVLDSPVQYQYHPAGEDIGLAISLEEHGFDRWVVPGARGEHVHDKPEEVAK